MNRIIRDMLKLAEKFDNKLEKISQEAVDYKTQLAHRVKSNLLAILGSKNWGAVEVNQFSVTEENGVYTVSCDVVIPRNSPPFTNKTSYPHGVAQFKQEVIRIISTVASGLQLNVKQLITVNGR